MTLQELYRNDEDLPHMLRDLADAAEMVDGWLLRQATVDADQVRYMAYLLYGIAERAAPLSEG